MWNHRQAHPGYSRKAQTSVEQWQIARTCLHTHRYMGGRVSKSAQPLWSLFFSFTTEALPLLRKPNLHLCSRSSFLSVSSVNCVHQCLLYSSQVCIFILSLSTSFSHVLFISIFKQIANILHLTPPLLSVTTAPSMFCSLFRAKFLKRDSMVQWPHTESSRHLTLLSMLLLWLSPRLSTYLELSPLNTHSLAWALCSFRMRLNHSPRHYCLPPHTPPFLSASLLPILKYFWSTGSLLF